MSEERLRLIAEFRDNASAGVRRLGRELGEVRETPGMNAAAKWMKGFELNAKAMQQAGTGAGSVMGSLGLGGVAAAGGIAAAVKSFKDLADQTTTLQSISRETGIAVTQLKIFQNAARDLHVDPGSITKGVENLTGQLDLARRGLGNLYGLLNQVEPEFMRKIMNEDPTSAMKDVLDRLAKIPDAYVRAGHSLADGIQEQKRWTQAMLGDEGINRMVEQGPKALADAMARAAKNTPVVTKAMIEAAEALHQSIIELDDSMDKFQTEAGPFIFKQLTAATHDFTELFKEIQHTVEWFEKVKDHPFKALAEAAVSGIDDAAKRNASTEDRATRARGPQDKMRIDLPGLASKAIHGVIGDKTLRRGEFAPAKDDADRTERLAKMQADLAAADAKLKADKNPVGFPVREADTIARTRELRDAIATMKDSGASPVRPAIVPPPVPSNDPSTLDKLRDAMKAGVHPAPIVLPPAVQSAPVASIPHPVSRAPAPMVVAPASPAPRPASPPILQPAPRVAFSQPKSLPAPIPQLTPRVDLPQPATRPAPPPIPQPAPRPAPLPIPQPDSAMQGLLQLNAYHGEERPSLLQRTAYHEVDEDGGERRGGMGSLTAEFREVISSGTKAGVMAAFRELTQERDMETTGGRGGIMNASFEVGGAGGGAGAGPGGGHGGGHGGAYGGGPAGHRAPSLRYNRPHENAPFKPADDGAVPTGAHTPLKDLIAQHETGGTGAAGYGTAYGHAEQPGSKMHALAPPKPLTEMSLSEVLAYQREMKPRAGSPAFPVGRAQWTESTLRGLTRGMDPNAKFSSEFQEKLFDRSIAGRIGQGVGGFRSEWDSLRGVQAGQIQSAIDGQRKAVDAATAAMPKPTAGAGGPLPTWMDERSKREAAGINKPLVNDLVAAAEEAKVHFRILQGRRTADEAAHNAATGRGVRNSQHLYGAAADIKLTDDKGRDLERNDPAYEKYAQAYESSSRAHGGQGRWLGHVPGWSWDRAHFDQGIGYGQSHKPDPFGVHGPTKDDVAQGNKEIFKSPDNPFLAKAHDQLASKSADALSAAHRLLKWTDKASKVDDPDGTPITTVDRRDPRFAPHPEPPRKSLLDEANKAGLGATTIKHEGGASLEVRFKNAPAPIQGTRVRTHGMIEAVNLRRGGLTPEVV